MSLENLELSHSKLSKNNTMKEICLNEICDLQNGYAFSSKDYVESSSTLNCRMSNIRPEGIFDIKYSAKYLPDIYVERYANYILKDGDLVIAMTDMANDPKILGVPTIVETKGYNVLLNQRVGKLIISQPDKIYTPYLQYVLNRKAVRSYYKKFAGGGLQLNVGKKEILSLKIPLPPLSEQKRIAAILDKADALRQKNKQLLATYDKLLQATFLDMFGDPVINPKGWDEVIIGESCYFVKDGPHLSPKYVDNGIPFISVNNIIKGYWDLSKVKYISEEDHKVFTKRCNPVKGDILYTKGGTTGFAKYIDIDLEFSNWVHLAVLKFDKQKVNGRFLEAMLNTSYCYQQSQKYTRGIANRDLVLGQMKKIKHYLPPIELQNKYAQIVENIEAQKAKIKQSLQESEDLFGALVQKAFKGEL